jgi:hypothetical protein
MLETDWLVAPGADYSQIRFEVKGAELSTDDAGHLIMSTPFGEIREGGLKVFQEGRQLEARWVISPLEGEVPGGVVSFEVMGHDPMLAMRIDPVVRVWGTYYGGSGNDSGPCSCATDGSSNVYLSCQTQSSAMISSNGHQDSYGGGTDAFLVKLNENGERLWATYYGGSGIEAESSTTTDVSGNVFLSGWTNSTNAIAYMGHQNTLGGNIDAYLVKFNSNGVRIWGTYYGGDINDYGYSCSTDTDGKVYLCGMTNSSESIAFNGHENVFSGPSNTFNAFMVKFDSDGLREWATYYGNVAGSGWSCATDANGNVYLAGQSASATDIAFIGHQNNYGGQW